MDNFFDRYDEDSYIEVTPPAPGAGDFSFPHAAPESQTPSENYFNQYDEDPDYRKNSDLGFDPMLTGVSIDSARESARSLTEAEGQGLKIQIDGEDQDESDKASFLGSFWHGLTSENALAFADTLDHLALMSDSQSNKDFYTRNAAGIRDSIQKDKSSYAAVYKSWKEIHGSSDFWGYTKEAVGRNLGMMFPSLVGSFSGGYFGGRAGEAVGGKFGGRVGGAVGAFTGALSGMTHLHISDMRKSLMREGVDGQKLKDYTNYGAAVLASLDLVFPMLIGLRMAGRLKGKVSSAVVRRLMKGGPLRTPAEFVRRYGSSMIKSVAIEVGTELAQEGITTFVPKDVAGKEITYADIEKFVTEQAPEVALQTMLTAGAISAIPSGLQTRKDIRAAKEEATFPGDRADLQAQQVAREGKGDLEQPAAEPGAPVAPVAEDATAEPASKQEPRPVDVIQFIRNIGGIRPTGELQAMDARRYPGLVSRKGLDVDKVRERLVEAGFLQEAGPDQPAVTTPEDVYDLVSRAMGGERIVAADQQYIEDSYVAQLDTSEAERQLADWETTHVLPELTRIANETRDPTISEAYDKLSPSVRNEVIERFARGNENLDDLIEEVTIREVNEEGIVALAHRAGATRQEVLGIRSLIEENAPQAVNTIKGLIAQAQELGAIQAESVHPGAMSERSLHVLSKQELIGRANEAGIPVSASANKAAIIRAMQENYSFPEIAAEDVGAEIGQAERGRIAAAQQALTPEQLVEHLNIVRDSEVEGAPAAQAEHLRQADSLAGSVMTMTREDAIRVAEEFLGRNLTGQERRSRARIADAIASEFTAKEVLEREGAPALTAELPIEGPVGPTPLAAARRARIEAAVMAAARKVLPKAVQVRVVDAIEIGKAARDARYDLTRLARRIDDVGEIEFETKKGGAFFADFAKPDENGNLHANLYPIDALPNDEPIGEIYLDFRGVAKKKTHGFSGPRFEVGHVNVHEGHQRQGIASALYDAVEKSLGIKLVPSGLLYDNGYKFWKARDPEAVRGHQYEEAEGTYISPLQISKQVAFLEQELPRLKNRGASEEKLADTRVTLKRYQKMWRKVPADLKEQSKLDRMFALRGFYSPSIRAAEGLSQEKGTGEQFWKQVSKAPGVRKDELEWMGLEEFLTDKRAITKDEVLSFMRAHQIELDEKVLGGEISPDAQALAFENFKNDFDPSAYYGRGSESLNSWLYETSVESRDSYDVKNGEGAYENASPVEIIREVEGDAALSRYVHEAWSQFQGDYIEAVNRDIGMRAEEEGVDATKFSMFKIPGGENYREILIRYPFPRARTSDDAARIASLQGQIVDARDAGRTERIEGLRAQIAEIEAQGSPTYISPHFQDQEIVHLRVDDRTGPNGEKVLFINEVQSDLHQKGRRQGYGLISPATKEEYQAINQEIDRLETEFNEKYADEPYEQFKTPERDADWERVSAAYRIRDELGDRDLAASQSVPNAPFKGDLWLELALKRALLYAAENGYDAVSWARSDQIAKAVGGDAKALSVQYDQKIGRFLNKYTKKWGGKVEEVVLPEFSAEGVRLIEDQMPIQEFMQFRVDEPNSFLRITPEMRTSVMEEQPLAVSRSPESQRLEALGQTDPVAGIISIAMRATEAEAEATGKPVEEIAGRVFRHEVVELFRGVGLFDNAEWTLLQETARKEGWLTPEIRANYEAVYKGKMSEAELEQLLIKEAIAEKYGEFHLGDVRVGGRIKRIFQRIKDYLARVGNWMRGMGFQKWDDVFQKIDRGELARRFEAEFGAPAQQGGGATKGAVRAGVLPDAPGFQPRQGAIHPVVGLATIIRDFREALRMPVRQGRLDPALKMAAGQRGGRLYGQYNTATGMTRLAVANDFDSMTHEGGHLIEQRHSDVLNPIIQAHAAELGSLAQAIGYQVTDTSEGFAEFFRRYITNPQAAQAQAPGFFYDFEQAMNAAEPEMLGRMQNVQAAYLDFLAGSPLEVGRAQQSILVGRDNAFTRMMQDAEDRGWGVAMSDRIHWLYYDTIASNHGWWMATRGMTDLIEQVTGRRIELPAINNPNKLLRMLPHTNAWAQRDLKDGIALRNTPNGGGPSMHDVLRTAFGGIDAAQWNEPMLEEFGEYLIARRAVHLYVLHDPRLRQVVQQYVATDQRLNYLLPNLPSNIESELQYPPTLQPLMSQLQKLSDLEWTQPRFQLAAETYYQFNRNILDFLLEKHLISQEEHGRLYNSPDYAPFQRDMSDVEKADGSETSRRPKVNGPLANKYDVYRRIQGSPRKIINPIQSTIQFVYEMRLRAQFNDTLRAMDSLASQAGPGSGEIFERIPSHEASRLESPMDEVLRRAGRAAGLSQADILQMTTAVESFIGPNATAEIFAFGRAAERGERIVWFYENGKPVAAQLADGQLGQMMYEAFTTLGRRSPDMWLQVLSHASGAVRTGVTLAPEFILRNIFVDSLVAPINSPYARPFLTQVRGVREILSGGRYHELYNRYAGMMGGAQTQAISDQSIDRDINDLRERGFAIRRPRTVREFFKVIFQVSEFSETATRIGIFRNAMRSFMADGMTEQQAAFEAGHYAHDVMDFSRHGSKTEVLRRAIVFFGAATQGMDRYARSMIGANTHGNAIRAWLDYNLAGGRALTSEERIALRQAGRAWIYTTLVFGGMSMLFKLIGADDEDLKEVPQRVRATHWIVSIDGVLHLIPKDMRAFISEEDTDILLRLPKGFETAWFANAMERGWDALEAEDPTAFNEYMKDLWDITAPPNSIPFSDLAYGWMAGKNWYTGRDIVPFWEQELERADQYGPYTSEVAKQIGRGANVSPYYVDYLARGIGASVARDAISTYDIMHNYMTGKGAEPGVEDYPVARRFLYNVGKNSRSLGQFYDMYRNQEGFVNWFWDTMSADARSFSAAKTSYRRLKVDHEDEAAAEDLYRQLNPDQKVFATLGVDFTHAKSKYRELHPIENAAAGIGVANKLMKEIVSNRIKLGRAKEAMPLTRQQVGYLRNELAHIRRGMAQNGLQIVGVPGWANVQRADIGKRMQVVKGVSEDVYDELVRRLKKEHVLDFNHVAEVWPEVKERVLADRDKALLGDLYSPQTIEAD